MENPLIENYEEHEQITNQFNEKKLSHHSMNCRDSKSSRNYIDIGDLSIIINN